LTFNTPMMLTC